MKILKKIEDLFIPVMVIGLISMFTIFAISTYNLGSGVKYKVKEYQRGLENEIYERRVINDVIFQYLYSHAHEGLEGREVILYDEVSK